MTIRSRYSWILAAILSVSFASSCMKTRTQIRREAEEGQRSSEASQGSKGMRTEVTEVAADPKAIDELRSEIVRLGGRLEELERTNQDLNQQNSGKTEEVKKLEGRIQELETAQIQLIEGLKKKERETPKVEPIAFFEQGKAHHQAKRHAEAIVSIDEYLKFPKGRHTEEAHLIRGDSYYAQKQYKKAILDYSVLQEKYPKSKKMAHVLMRIGNAFDAMGMKADAKVFYQELIDRYPRAPEAKRVASKIR